MSSIEAAFTELFYGSGAWLGLLLFLVIIVVLSMKNKFAGVLMLPVTVFLGIDYLDYPDLMWNAVIMFFASIVILINVIGGKE